MKKTISIISLILYPMLGISQWEEIGSFSNNFEVHNPKILFNPITHELYSIFYTHGSGGGITVRVFNGSSWDVIGGNSPSGFTPTIEPLFSNNGELNVVTMDYGGSLFKLHTLNNNSLTNSSSLTINNNNYWPQKDLTACYDRINNQIVATFSTDGGGTIHDRKYTILFFDGMEWIPLGQSLNTGSHNFKPGVLKQHPDSGDLYFAFAETNIISSSNIQYNHALMKFNGSTWEQVGPYFFNNQDNISSIDLIFHPVTGNPIVAYFNHSTSKFEVKTYNGTTWSMMGLGVSCGAHAGNNAPSLAFHPISNELYLAFQNNSNGDIEVKRFNNSSWITIGDSPGNTQDQKFGDPQISFHPLNSELYITYYDPSSLQVKVKKFIGTLNISESTQQFIFSLYPNPVQNTLFINGQFIYSVGLYNSQGTLILETSSQSLDVSSLTPGVYFCRINGTHHLRFVKE